MKKLKLILVMATLCLFFNQAKAQAIQITGVINDNQGKTLSGATIQILNQKGTTTSKTDGTFSIASQTPTGTLKISYLGYQSKEIQYNSNLLNRFRITLEENNKTLEEIQINAGYYTVSQKQRTGSIASIKAETISQQPVSNPILALQGRIPGVYIQNSSGISGSSVNLQIRGQNSLRSEGNSPLYLIDGVPFLTTSLTSATIISPYLNGTSPLNNLNPSDIASIEVLKDADATTIYGSRGANGVILITTKKGNSGSTKLDINLNQGTGKVSYLWKLLNTPDYLTMRKEAYKNDGTTPSGNAARDLLIWDQNRYTDWQKELIGKTSHTTNAQASISGGSEQTQFLFSTGYYRESTVFAGDGILQKGSGQLNVNHTSANKKFSGQFSASYHVDDNNIANTDFTRLALTLSPNAPSIYTPSGELNWENSTWENPIATTRKRYKAKTENLNANASLSYQLGNSLQLKSSFGLNNIYYNEFSSTPISAQNPAFLPLGASRFANNSTKVWNIEPQLNYSKSISKGSLSALIGGTFQQNTGMGQSLIASGFTSDELLENVKAAGTSSVDRYNAVKYRYNALFGRINYNWQERYIINLTARRDGSSRFGADRQFANFGAIGLAWLFSKEKFLLDKYGLSTGKLRISYGTTGSDQIPDYGYLDTYSPSTYGYQGGNGLLPTRLANPNYSWEVNKKFDTSLELGFWKDRLLMEFSYFRNRSSNQLVGYSLSNVTGFPSIQANLPAVLQNTGVELTLSSVNLQLAKFSWKSAFNLTLPDSKLISYPNISGSSYADSYQVGSSLDLRKTYRFTGINPNTGIYTFEDLNHDGSYSISKDGSFIKEVGRKYYGGLLNTFQFQGIELNIFFQFVKQTGRDYTYSGFSSPGTLGNKPTDVLQRWQQAADQTAYQKFTIAASGTNAYTMRSNSDLAITDASFIRLKNLSLSYNLPEEWNKKLRIKGSKIYLQGQNLFTITHYKGDPEIMNISVLPSLRMLTAGIQLTF